MRETRPYRTLSRRSRRLLRALALGLGVIMAVAGATKLVGLGAWVAAFDRFGYPQTFRWIVGGVELLASALLFLPLGRELGATLTLMVMLGAAVSHGLVGDWAWIPLPLVIATAAAILAWADRPQTLGTSYPQTSVTLRSSSPEWATDR